MLEMVEEERRVLSLNLGIGSVIFPPVPNIIK